MNSFRLALRKIVKAKFFIGLLIVGIVFSVAGIMFLKSPKTTTYSATATITGIEYISQSVGEMDEYIVSLKYTDKDGVVHNATIGAYSSSWKVGTEIQIEYDPENFDAVSLPGSEYIPCLVLGIGAVIIVVSMVKLIIAVRTPDEDTNEFNRVDMSHVSSEQVESVRNNDEELKSYFFHFTGKLNQSYIMETDPSRKPVMEAFSQKLSVVTKYEFNFINHLTGREEIKVCSHTVSTEYGAPSRLLVNTDASFTINGVKCWNALGQLGYSLNPRMDGLHICYDVLKFGVKVGSFETAGTNVATGKNYKWGNVPTPGIYRVSCRESDIEGIFLACFIVSRTYD